MSTCECGKKGMGIFRVILFSLILLSAFPCRKAEAGRPTYNDVFAATVGRGYSVYQAGNYGKKTFTVGDYVYVWGFVHDINNNLYKSYSSGTCNMKLSIFKPDGSCAATYQYNNCDNSWIGIAVTVPGTWRIQSNISGSILGTNTGTITVRQNAVTARSISDGEYYIRYAANLNYSADIENGSHAEDANVQLYSTNYTPAQKFCFEYLGNGYYCIMNSGSRKFLTKSGSNVIQYSYCGWESQQWAVESVGSGVYYLRCRAGAYLDNAYATQRDKNNIWTYTGNQTDAQKWKLISTAGAAPAPEKDKAAAPANVTSGAKDVSGVKTSDKGIDLLINMERPVSKKYCKYDSSGRLTAIKNADIGDGGITVGYGSYFPYVKGTKKVSAATVEKYRKKYGINVGKVGEYVSVSVCRSLFKEEVAGKEEVVRKWLKKKGYKKVKQCVFDAMVIQAYNGFYDVIMKAYIDDSVSENKALSTAVNKYKTFRNWSKYSKGWTNRLRATVRVAKRGVYVKDY